MVNIKPCPFCGATEISLQGTTDDMWVWCTNESCAIYDVEIDYEKWNTRAKEDE